MKQCRSFCANVTVQSFGSRMRNTIFGIAVINDKEKKVIYTESAAG